MVVLLDANVHRRNVAICMAVVFMSATSDIDVHTTYAIEVNKNRAARSSTHLHCQGLGVCCRSVDHMTNLYIAVVKKPLTMRLWPMYPSPSGAECSSL